MIKQTGDLSVPIHLRNAPTKLMKELGYGAEYQYSHETQDKLHEQEFLPPEISNTPFFRPSNAKREDEMRKYLAHVWKGKYGYK